MIISCTKHLHNSFCIHFDAFWCILMHFEHVEKKLSFSTKKKWNFSNFYAQNYHKSAVVTLKWAKIGDLGAKIAHFLLNAQNASICIRMHQNVCRMNCANVLCKKISKKWIWLHLNRLKLMNYFLHFVFADRVVKCLLTEKMQPCMKSGRA